MKAFAEGAKWEPAVQWINSNVYDWSKVTEYNSVVDLSRAPKIELLDYQADILDVVLTPIPCKCKFKDKKARKTGEITKALVGEVCGNCITGQTGRFPYSTVIWSQPKKHGKTQIAGAVAAWIACKIEAPNFVLTLASNQEQSAGLIFSALKPTIFAHAGKVPTATNAVPEIRLPNGTLLKAIPNNYAGQAGGNYGATFWSELWTYKSVRDRKLWDELPPVPTRHNSIRWVETYAGFEDESDLLMDQFLRIFTDTTERQTQPKAKPVPGLEHIKTQSGGDERPSCWHIPEEGLFVFWDHEIRAPWITAQYIKEQKAENRHSTFVRLWQNRWQSSEGTFVEPELVDRALTLDGEEWGSMVLAGDGSQRNDHTALVGVQKRKVKLFGKEQERYRVMRVRVWDPETFGVKKGSEMMALGAKKGDLDLTGLIAADVKRLYEMGAMQGPFHYDPMQMHDVAMQLRKLKVPCVEFPQGQERLKADSFLWKLFNEGRIDMYDCILTDHVKSANAKEYENEQVRIIKGEASSPKKVDAAVALSMAVWRASKVLELPKRKNKSVSISLFD